MKSKRKGWNLWQVCPQCQLIDVPKYRVVGRTVGLVCENHDKPVFAYLVTYRVPL